MKVVGAVRYAAGLVSSRTCNLIESVVLNNWSQTCRPQTAVLF